MRCSQFSFRQRGATLVIALVFLLILTLIGLAASQVSIQQERMAGNFLESQIALQSAESTLRWAEQQLAELADGGSSAVDNPPLWVDGVNTADLVSLRSDCTLDRRFDGNWDSVGWLSAPEGVAPHGGQYFVLSLSEYQVVVAGEEIEGVPCRPMGEMTRPDGTPLNPQFYLVLARAYGPGGETRRAQASVQAIYYRESAL